MQPAKRADASEDLRFLIRDRPISPERIRRFLDERSHEARVAAIRSLSGSELHDLYVAVDGFKPVTLEDLVPPAVEDFATVRHHGKNSLPVFTHFEKRLCRPPCTDSEPATELYGYNFQSLASITGPGYFIARESADRPEVMIDYHSLPPEHPQGWPPLRSNDRGLSRLVFGFLFDTLRGVSDHVTIGSASRKGRDLGSWFALCRED
ncbi:MAG: SseB family protein [Deltaproteobacteria bacterium]|jgi:hypothetical protein|nr:SseB family protein [Deltaproteobacteria bacterium]MBW2540888.1 SseB family protein [Deltaproteobacteria bacterium]